MKRQGNGTVAVLFCLFVNCAALALTGCSSDRIPTHPAKGRVTFSDGSPVRTGVVEMQSLEHGLNARGKIDREGRFTLGTFAAEDGAVAGKHQAIVVQFLAMDSDPFIEHDHGDPVDAKFAEYTTSGLEYMIEAGTQNVLDVQVTRSPSSN